MPHIQVSASQVQGLTVGSVVRVTIRGRVTSLGIQDGDAGGDPQASVDVDGEASIEPGTLDDAARVAFSQLSNAKGPVDFPTSRRELHAP